jgi:hypothetical protein
MSTSKNPLSLEAAVGILAATFQDPSGSHVCASRLRVAADRMDTEVRLRKSASDKAKFAKSQYKLLRNAIRFFTLKQFPAEYLLMMNVLMRCTCNLKDPKMRDLHTPGQHIPDGKIYPDDINSLRLTVRIVASVSRCLGSQRASFETWRNRRLRLLK